MGITSSTQGPSTPPQPAGYNPYAAGPYAGASTGYGAPVMGMMMTPEQLQFQMMRGGPAAMMMAAPSAGMGYPVPAPPPRVEHATTIKNDTNVRKGTLKFVCRDSEPSRLYLQFNFDANTPCAISVYYGFVSNEAVPPGTSLLQRLAPFRYGHCGKRTLFPRGLGQTYNQALHGQEWLDVRAFTENELTNAPAADGSPGPSTSIKSPTSASGSDGRRSFGAPSGYESLPAHLYPIVVVIETLPDVDPALAAAAAAAPSTGVVAPAPNWAADTTGMAPGSAASPARLQATYATLTHRPGEDARLRGSSSGSGTAAAVGGGGSSSSSSSSAAGGSGGAGGVAGFRETHDWTIKCIQQRLQIAGQVYAIREIYGMDGGEKKGTGTGDGSAAGGADDGGDPATAPAGAGEDVLASGSDCVICLTDKRDTTVLPCRHMCMCYDCARQLQFAGNKCPVCRTPVQSLLQLKIASAADSAGPGAAATT